MRRYGVNSVFRRLFIRFVGVIVFVFMVVAILFYQYVTAQREAEVSGQVNRATNVAAVITQQIRAAVNVEQELFADPQLKKLSQGVFEDNYERGQLILDIQSSIVRAKLMNGIIQDIVVTFPSQGVEVSAVNGYQKRVYTPDMFSEEQVYLQRPLTFWNGELRMGILHPLILSLDENEMPDYTIEVVLSGEYLQNFLQTFHNRELAGAAWVYHDGGQAQALYSDADPAYLSLWSRHWTQSGSPDQYQKMEHSSNGSYQFVSDSIPDYNLVLVTWQDSSELGGQLWKTMVITGVLVLGMSLVMWLLVLWAKGSISKPIYIIMDAFEKVQGGDLSVCIHHDKNDEFSYIYDAFNDTIRKTGDLMESTREQAILLQKAEQIQLQSQINPHFLYNSFYNIKFMAKNEEYEQIDAMVTALAKYYRFLNKQTEQNVTLETEAAHMANYITVQQMRFEEKISVDIAPVPKEVAHMKVPKLILQPVVENAYNYGLKDILADGHLSVSYVVDEHWLDIIIEDNGGSISAEKLEAMDARLHIYEGDAVNHALTNIQRRLLLAYGEGSGVSLEVGAQRGLRVTLRINRRVSLF